MAENVAARVHDAALQAASGKNSVDVFARDDEQDAPQAALLEMLEERAPAHLAWAKRAVGFVVYRHIKFG